jgi:hypothetical protein
MPIVSTVLRPIHRESMLRYSYSLGLARFRGVRTDITEHPRGKPGHGLTIFFMRENAAIGGWSPSG